MILGTLCVLGLGISLIFLLQCVAEGMFGLTLLHSSLDTYLVDIKGPEQANTLISETLRRHQSTLASLVSDTDTIHTESLLDLVSINATKWYV